jgi:hypothetical protein
MVPEHPCAPVLVGERLVAFDNGAIEVWDPSTLQSTSREDVLSKTCLARVVRDDGSTLVLTDDGVSVLGTNEGRVTATAPKPLEGWTPRPPDNRVVVGAPSMEGGALFCRASGCFHIDRALGTLPAPPPLPQLGEGAEGGQLGDGRTIVRGGGTLLFTWRPGEDGWRVHPDPGGTSGWATVGERTVVIAGHPPTFSSGRSSATRVVTVRGGEERNMLDALGLRSKEDREKAKEAHEAERRAAAERDAQYLRVDAQPVVALEIGRGHRADRWRASDVKLSKPLRGDEHPVGFVQVDAQHAVLLLELSKDLNRSAAAVFHFDEAGKVTDRREDLKAFVGANHVRETSSGDRWLVGLRDGRGPVVERARIDLPLHYEALGAGLKLLRANNGFAPADLTATYFYRPSPATAAGAVAKRGALDQERVGAAATESPTGRLVLVGHDPSPLSKLPMSYSGIIKMLATYRLDLASERKAMTTVSALNLKTGSTTALPRMATGRAYPGLSALPDGRLLVTGGRGHPAREHDHQLPSIGPAIPDAVLTVGTSELFTKGSWSPGPTLTPRAEHAQRTLPTGVVVVIGGVDRPIPKGPTRLVWPGVERWQAGDKAFAPVGSAPVGGYGHTLLTGAGGDLLYLTRSLDELVLVELSPGLDEVTLSPIGVAAPAHRHDVQLVEVGERLLLVSDRKVSVLDRR